jgi:hypothetical protein
MPTRFSFATLGWGTRPHWATVSARPPATAPRGPRLRLKGPLGGGPMPVWEELTGASARVRRALSGPRAKGSAHRPPPASLPPTPTKPPGPQGDRVFRLHAVGAHLGDLPDDLRSGPDPGPFVASRHDVSSMGVFPTGAAAGPLPAATWARRLRWSRPRPYETREVGPPGRRHGGGGAPYSIGPGQARGELTAAPVTRSNVIPFSRVGFCPGKSFPRQIGGALPNIQRAGGGLPLRVRYPWGQRGLAKLQRGDTSPVIPTPLFFSAPPGVLPPGPASRAPPPLLAAPPQKLLTTCPRLGIQAPQPLGLPITVVGTPGNLFPGPWATWARSPGVSAPPPIFRGPIRG